ncbi:MAG: ABC transporter ATP-binding protein/permease [Burkholderiaceae bacterium]
MVFAFWTGPRRRSAWLTALALVVFTIAQVAIPIALNVWSQHLFDAIEQRDTAGLLRQIGNAGLIVLASLVVMTTHLRLRRRLQVDWRAELTDSLLGQWIPNGRHYQLSQLPGQHDNPDGRIAEDIRIATEYTVDLAHSLFYCVLLLVSFTQILWHLSGPPDVQIAGWSIYLPGHLVWIALLYAGAGAFAATLLGRPLMRAANRRQDKEADFRVGLVRVRETALSTALHSTEKAQQQAVGRLFADAVDAWRQQTRALAHLFMFSSSWSVLTQAVPVLVAAPRYMAGSITLGVLMQTAQAFQQMIAALSWPIDNMQKLAECRTSIARVVHMKQALNRLQRPTQRTSDTTIRIAPGEQARLEIDDLCLRTAAGKTLLEHFSVSIEPGERVVLQGDPLTALNLFRAISGIWPWGSGLIRLPRDEPLHFLPRRMRLGHSTLRAILAGAGTGADPGDVRLRAALQAVGLQQWQDRLDEPADWSERLSSPERQRLGVAQVLLLRPRWIFMREATSALDALESARMFSLIRDTIPGATIVAIGRDAAQALGDHRVVVLPCPTPGSAPPPDVPAPEP